MQQALQEECAWNLGAWNGGVCTEAIDRGGTAEQKVSGQGKGWSPILERGRGGGGYDGIHKLM